MVFRQVSWIDMYVDYGLQVVALHSLPSIILHDV